MKKREHIVDDSLKPIFVPWGFPLENIPTIIHGSLSDEKISKYFHEVPNEYLAQFIINSKEND